MNRRKKGNQILKARAKKANAKLAKAIGKQYSLSLLKTQTSILRSDLSFSSNSRRRTDIVCSAIGQ
jgi:hypothetical protein